MHLKAWQQTSLIEFPGRIADVVYVGMCDFRCPFCYNVDLVLHPDALPDLDTAETLRKLSARRGFIDGLVVTGGEPTLQADLLEFLAQARVTGLAVKLDTNGSRPDVLRACLERRLVDYVAMDIKSSPTRYAETAGVAVDLDAIRQSVDALLHSSVDYEFRTTVFPGLVELQDVQAIAAWIAGARAYYLQAFRPGPTLEWGDAPPVRAPAPAVMRSMAQYAACYVQHIGLRGVTQD